MQNKTPKFDAKIQALLSELAPSERICSTCKQTYLITDEDIKTYNEFQVPPPSECFQCRRRRRFAFCNYTNLYKILPDNPGAEKQVVSSIPKSTGTSSSEGGRAHFPIYDYDSYWTTDMLQYGHDLDLSKTFIEQFSELFTTVPQVATTRDPSNINSEYTLYGMGMKNCYLVSGGINAENTMFSMWAVMTKESADLLISLNTDNCYEGVFPENCFNCNYTYYSKNCMDSWFMYDCRGCSDCFGCVNLRNQKYCFFNEQLSKEEYGARVSEIIKSESYKIISEYKEKFFNFVKSQPIRATRNEKSENYSGNFIVNSRNCFDSFWVLQGENCRGVDFSMRVRECVEVCITNDAEKTYNNALVGDGSYNTKFSLFGRTNIDCEYVMNCRNVSNSFGCIGLQNQKFCILNKQYGEEEYWAKVDEIKCAMIESGAYGNFFSYSLSPYPYNASLANMMYPAEKAEVEDMGGWWHEEPQHTIEAKTVGDMPDGISEVGDEILAQAFKDEYGKAFRIIPAELEFYRRKHLPLPRVAPLNRFMERFTHTNNFRAGREICAKCGEETESSYFAKDGYLVYCDICHNKEIV